MTAYDEKSFVEFMNWIRNRYPDPHEVTERLIELLTLHKEHARLYKEMIDGQGKNWGSILARLIIESYHELRKAGRN